MLISSLEEHRIVNVEPATPKAEEPPAGEPEAKESVAPLCAEPSSKGEKEKAEALLEAERQGAEADFEQILDLSHGCRQSLDMLLKGKKGSTRKINWLFYLNTDDSLILHEVARAADLPNHGQRDDVYTLYMGLVESSCAYWVPLKDWKGEPVYIEAREVDYIARLPGAEDPVRWYDQFPSLAAARDPRSRRPTSI